MKKLILCLLIAAMLFCIVSCTARAHYDYLQSTDAIQTIEIVIVTFADELPPSYEVKHVVKDVNLFTKDFENIPCYLIYTDPKGVDNGETVIKITYKNGDYELVGVEGRATCIKGVFLNYEGYRYFDEEQFQALLDKYLAAD